MVKVVDRAEKNRQDKRIQERKNQAQPKPKDSDFNEVLRKSNVVAKAMPQVQKQQSKVVTEYAIREAVKHQDRRGDEDKKEDKDGRDESRDSRQKGKKSEGKIADQKVIAKGTLKKGTGQSGGGKHGGFGMASGKRQMAKILTKAGARSLPADLKGRFASKLAQVMKGKGHVNQAVLSQQVLNNIIQFVKIGMNRKGDKEIQVDLHEKIFKGLKLRVIAHEGKVSVMFTTADKKGKKVLEKNKDDISKALKDKGIDVDEITIT